MQVESRARELALSYSHLDVAFARNSSAVGDVHVFQLVHASAQVAAHPSCVSQGEATSRHGQFTADTAAHLGIASEDGRAAPYFSLQADVAGANHDTFAHASPVIHTQGLHPAVNAVAQLSVQVERLRKIVDAAFHGSADHRSLGKTDQVAFDTATHLHSTPESQQVPIDHAFHTHGVAGGQEGVVHGLIRRYGDKLTVTPLQSKAGQRQRKQHDQQVEARLV